MRGLADDDVGAFDHLDQAGQHAGDAAVAKLDEDRRLDQRIGIVQRHEGQGVGLGAVEVGQGLGRSAAAAGQAVEENRLEDGEDLIAGHAGGHDQADQGVLAVVVEHFQDRRRPTEPGNGAEPLEVLLDRGRGLAADLAHEVAGKVSSPRLEMTESAAEGICGSSRKLNKSRVTPGRGLRASTSTRTRKLL